MVVYAVELSQDSADSKHKSHTYFWYEVATKHYLRGSQASFSTQIIINNKIAGVEDTNVTPQPVTK